MDRLHTRGVIHVSHGGNIAARNIQLLDSEERLLFRSHRPTATLDDVGYQKHVRAVLVQLEPILEVFPANRRREWTKAFAILDFQVQRGLHARGTRIAENRSRPQTPRSEFHSALEPSD